jgi:hypothetical protein
MTMTKNTNTNNNMSSMHMNNMNNSNSNSNSNHTSVPDLLSFDSWDYDGDSNNMVSATSSFTTDTSLAPSCDENDPHHHHRSSSASSSSSFTAPVFATDDIHIQVSGASFILNPTVFRQLENLPWSLVSNCNDENNVVYSLGTSPDLFEIVLNYVLFESLPNMKLLSQSDIEELEPMVLITGLQGLQNHLEKKDLKTKFFRRNTASTSKAVPAQRLHQQLERHISTNNMNKNGSSSKDGNDKDKDSKNNKPSHRQISAPPVLGTSSSHVNNSNNSSNNLKGMASRLVQAVSRRRPSQQQQQNQQGRKLTHAQCVLESELVD